MPVNANNTQNTQPNSRRKSAASRSDRRQTSAASRSDSDRIREGLNKARDGSVSYVRQTAERSVDVPVGVALTVTDRVSDIVEPFTTRQTANRELKSMRTRAERELNRLERRGASARRKSRTRVRRTRNRVERELNRRRRNVRTAVKQNRTKAEGNLKKAQTAVQERVSALV